jgi:hypothetical protein
MFLNGTFRLRAVSDFAPDPESAADATASKVRGRT